MSILIYYYIILLKYNLLFKPNKLDLTLFTYIINSSIEVVLTRNNLNIFITFIYKTSLGYIIKISYNNYYFINSKLVYLTSRSLKKTY